MLSEDVGISSGYIPDGAFADNSGELLKFKYSFFLIIQYAYISVKKLQPA